jgi:peptidoglycan/LPS O-acetylase OafA/YrhL
MAESQLALSASTTAPAETARAAAVPVAPAATGRVTDRLDALDGLRALAALHVFLVHYVALFAFLLPEGSPTLRALRGVFTNGFQGAYLFFVLSGFLIYRSLLRRQQPIRRYLGRRVRRIYPTFAAVFVLYLALSAVFPARSKIPADGATQYLLSNALLLPGVFPIRAVVTVAWTLSYEIFFYLGIGALVMGLGMRSWSPSARALFFVGCAALYLATGDAAGLRLAPFLMFLPGILLLDLLDDRRNPRRPPPPVDARPLIPLALAGLLGAVALAGFRGPAGGIDATAATFRAHAGIGICFGILVWLSIGGSRRFSRFCTLRPLRWLGEISYSFYLIHGLVLGAIAMVLKPLLGTGGSLSWLFWIGVPLTVAAAAAVANVLFVAVERRFSLVREVRAPPA